MENRIFKIDISKAAMSLGTMLGLYQTVKLLLFPLSMRFQFLSPVLFIMVLGVPVVAWKLVRDFRNRHAQDFFPFISAWLTTILMFFFATVLSAVIAYAYLLFIDHGAFFPAMADFFDKSAAELSAGQVTAETKAMLDEIGPAIEMLRTLSPLQATKQLVVSNALFWSNLFSLVIAIITSRPQPFNASNNK